MLQISGIQTIILMFDMTLDERTNIFDCIVIDDLIPIAIKKCRANMSGSKRTKFPTQCWNCYQPDNEKENIPGDQNIINQVFENN